jgi:DNA-binding response OmpR family regulator
MNICIIEDDPATRMLMRALVNSGTAAKHTVLECISGEDAFSKLQVDNATRYDVFLVDLDLPGISGIEIIRRLRESWSGGNEYLPYIMMVTAHEASEALTPALEAGANDYLTKPVNAKVLQTRLRVAQKLVEQAGIGAQEDYVKALISYSAAQAALPLAIIDCDGPEAEWKISFANTALAAIFPASADTPLDVITSWTPEFRANAWHSLAHAQPFRGQLSTTQPEIDALALEFTIIPTTPAPSAHALVFLQPRVG